jgi:hypothetical protein
MHLPAKRQPLGFSCPKCGRNNGSLRLKIIRKNREKMLQKNIQASRLAKDGFGKSIRKIGFSRNSHTYKYDTFFGDFDPDRNPIINLPLPELSDESYLTKMEEIEKTMITFFLFLLILPLIFRKYPDLAAKFGVLEPYIRAFIEYCQSFMDNRWDRSMTEWMYIVAYAKAHGYNAASRKFPAKKDGKEKYLSPNHIKQKTKIIDRFLGYFENDKDGEVCHKYMMEVKKKLENDKELLSIRKGFLEHINEIMDELLNISSNYSYKYYYIMHYDANRYRKSKSDLEQGLIKKRTQVTGKIECGPFKEKDLPVDQIRRHKSNFGRLLEILAGSLVMAKLHADSSIASPNSRSRP